MPCQAATGKAAPLPAGAMLPAAARVPRHRPRHAAGTVPITLRGRSSLLGSGTSSASSSAWSPPLVSHSLCSPWPCSLAWKSRQPPASGSWTAEEGGGSGSMAARGLEAPGLLLPDSCQTSAAGESQLQPSSAGKTTEEGSSREGQPAQHACHLGWGTPIWQGGAARCPQTVLLEPPAPLALPCCLWHGSAPQGHWVTCPGSHGSSVAETGSIDFGSLNPPLFPTSTEADSVPGPKERGLGEMRPLFLFWL